MSQISLQNLKKSFGKTQVIHDLSIDVKDGELIVIVGPSGCGKSTLLRMVAGLEDANEGKVEIKNDKLGNVHLSIGKVSFDEAKLAENLDEVIAVLNKAKPSSSKGEFIKTVHMSSTMGPSIIVDINI